MMNPETIVATYKAWKLFNRKATVTSKRLVKLIGKIPTGHIMTALADAYGVTITEPTKGVFVMKESQAKPKARKVAKKKVAKKAAKKVTAPAAPAA